MTAWPGRLRGTGAAGRVFLPGVAGEEDGGV